MKSAGKTVALRIVAALVGLIVVGVGGFVIKNLTGDASTAKVGDCMSREGRDEVKVVECSDPKAVFTVGAKIEGKTETEFSTDERICAAAPGATQRYWQGKRGRAGYVLCLVPKK
ncbi:hypothetical protein D5H75_19195 [Bailinhaonella thermotolerans]|uniref:Uncharacterized protein n=1 Tax=Bailinhaonella thermotolerans TaxID=1070861 RepID=A0A3A4ANF3_9ACTN|nr:hypothetical protein D5H75_19195 [Bailinhaonella thermotolerans]